MDEATKKQIDQGARMVEILKQKQYVPQEVSKQVVLIFAGANGFLDDIPVSKLDEFETEFLDYMESLHGKLLKEINKVGKLTDDMIEKLEKIVTDFKKNF